MHNSRCKLYVHTKICRHFLSTARGLRLLSQRHMDAVVVDYEMPRMDGAMAAANIRYKCSMIPIIMLTGWAGKRPFWWRSGIDDFVEKGEPTGKRLIASLRKQIRFARCRLKAMRDESQRDFKEALWKPFYDEVFAHGNPDEP